MNFKIWVQRVWLNLRKTGLGAAYRARIYRLEHRRLGFERRILKTHVGTPFARMFRSEVTDALLGAGQKAGMNARPL